MIERLEALDFPMHASLQTDLILQSLPDSFSQFVVNFNCNEIACNLAGLMNKLTTAQSQMKTKGKEAALVIYSGTWKSKNKKKKGKKQLSPKDRISKGKGKAPMVQKSKEAKKMDVCLNCGERGHWKRHCPNLTVMCRQDLEQSRKLDSGEVMVTVGSGHSVEASDIGSLMLDLESGFIPTLDDVLVLPKGHKNIVSIPVMDRKGFHFFIGDGSCRIYFRNKLVGTATLLNGSYHLNLKNKTTVNTITRKRGRDETNQALKWHLRLGHIGQTKVHKMEKDGLMGPLGSDPYPTCESCLQGKMTKLPFTGTFERAAEKLGLIHTDICGPFEVARDGFLMNKLKLASVRIVLVGSDK
ncbi:hypothetical protein OROMI_023164 [Orobanche minor]